MPFFGISGCMLASSWIRIVTGYFIDSTPLLAITWSKQSPLFWDYGITILVSQ